MIVTKDEREHDLSENSVRIEFHISDNISNMFPNNALWLLEEDAIMELEIVAYQIFASIVNYADNKYQYDIKLRNLIFIISFNLIKIKE